ncbi:hypothetical protein [Streptomyces tuirus]
MTSEQHARDDEQAAAGRFFARHFPEVAAFLARERAAATPVARPDAHLMRVDAPQVTPLSVARLMDTPLLQLADELGVTLAESGITDPGFTGYVYVDGRCVTVALPPGRSELEHDCTARYLIGRAFNVDGLPSLPDLFRVLDITAEVQQAQAAARRIDNEGRGSW